MKNPSFNTLKKMLLLLTFIVFGADSTSKISTPPNGVSIYKLDNGINVLLIENPALPMVGINTLVKVGSAYETFSSSGMSHMLEHLLFNGTPDWSQKQLYDMTDKIGAYNNANTSDYYTNYMMVAPADKIKQGMEIQAGMLFDSNFPAEKFDKEKGIVLEEIAKSLSNPRGKTSRFIREKLYANHALSLPTLGTYETIKNMNRDEVIAFYKNNYVPNNMEISVIGNFETTKMLKLLKEIYGQRKPGNVIRPNIKQWATGFDLPIKSSSQTMVDYRFYAGDNQKVQLFYALGNRTSDFNNLLLEALENSKQELIDSLKNSNPKQVEELSFHVHSQPVGSFLQAELVLNKGSNLTKITDSFDRLLQAQKFNLSQDYISAEAIKSKSSFLKQIEKPHMFGIYNADLIATQGLMTIIKKFSGEELISAGKELNQFSLAGNPAVLALFPHKKQESKTNKETETKLFQKNDNSAAIIAKQNSASNLLAIHYMFKYKQRYENQYGKNAAKKWHDLFGKRMKSEQSQKQIGKYGLSFKVNDLSFLPMDDIYLSPTFGYIRVEGLATNVEEVVSFLNHSMLNFKPTRKEFESVNKPAGSHMRQKNKGKELFKKHYKELVETSPQNDAGKELDYDLFLEFGKNYFSPQNIIISIVSKEPVETMNSYFSDFSTKTLAQHSGLAAQKSFKIRSSSVNIEEQIESEQAQTFYGFVESIDPNDRPALEVLSLMLKEEIVFDIREKQGLAYRMSAGIDIIKNQAMFYLKIPTQPKNVEKLTSQFPKLFSPKFAKSITQENLEKTINKHLGKMMFRRLSSINQAYYLAHSLYFDGSINADKSNLDDFKEVQLADVKRVAKKYITNNNPITIIIK